MNHNKEQVWQSFSGELARRRRSATIIRMSCLGLLLLCASMGTHLLMRQYMKEVPTMVETSGPMIPPNEFEWPPNPTFWESPMSLVVLVCRDDVLSLEMKNISEVEPEDLNFNLEPVIWSDSSPLMYADN